MFAYTVTLNRLAEFPLDMLRYSQSWPASSEDAAMIGRLTDPDYLARREMPRTVKVRLITSLSILRFDTSKARWRSFSAEVEFDRTYDAIGIERDHLVDVLRGLRLAKKAALVSTVRYLSKIVEAKMPGIGRARAIVVAMDYPPDQGANLLLDQSRAFISEVAA